MNLSLTHRQTVGVRSFTKARSSTIVVVVFETNFIQHAYKHFTLARHFVTKRRKFKQFSNRKCCATDTLTYFTYSRPILLFTFIINKQKQLRFLQP